MATYVLIPGAGCDSWHWHLVVPLLEQLGHDVVTPELPCSDETKTLDDYLAVSLEAVGDREDLVVVGQSLGGFTATLLAAARPTTVLVFLNGMIPKPGEAGGDWWTNTGHPLDWDEFDQVETFLHDVPPDVVAAGEAHVFPQADGPFKEPFPLEAMPGVPTRAIVSRDDRFFAADWMAGVVRDRLGIEPDHIDGGHCPALSRPQDLTHTLERLRKEETP